MWYEKIWLLEEDGDGKKLIVIRREKIDYGLNLSTFKTLTQIKNCIKSYPDFRKKCDKGSSNII